MIHIITTLSIMTHSIRTFSIMTLILTFSINNILHYGTQHNDIQYNDAA